MHEQPTFVTATVLEFLKNHAERADGERHWPQQSWSFVEQAGALRWGIPQRFGGLEVSDRERLQGYEDLATACLTSCFILTQRDAACRRILASGNDALCQELLPPLADGRAFATVGLSQLTTARRHIQPSFRVWEDGDALIFDGTIPWVTGASRAEHLVIGATFEDGHQVLCVLPVATPGVTIGEPLDLMALQGSITAEIRCEQVRLEPRWLLAGPVENVMQGKQGGAGGLQTSCLALGLARAAITFLRSESEGRSGLVSGTERLAGTLQTLQQEMYHLSEHGTEPDAVTRLRARANTLVVQATQAALIAAKGTGFVRGHPAQRWVRQAMFFLVWSCPWPAASATLDFLTLTPDGECV